MFNLSNLVLALNIATGVGANLTPICDKQNETQVIDYSENLEQINTTTTKYVLDTINKPKYPNTYSSTADSDREILTNYRSSSAYMNVYATKYETKNLRGSLEDVFYIQNRETILNNYDNYYKNCTTTILVMQIDTYNFNINTTITITNYLNVTTYNWTSGQHDFYVENRRFLKNVYTTTDNWSAYIQMTQRNFQAQYIREEIEDINNSFSYTKEQTLTNEINQQQDIGYRQIDTTELNLLPNTRNYVIIEYIPMAFQFIDDWNNPPYQDTTNNAIIVKGEYGGIFQTNYTINGTNIIPDGTYEVIDIPGLMWQILTMPFAFVSQAFNLTLFPGTPYQINIANLFLSILAIIFFVWLISFILKIKG